MKSQQQVLQPQKSLGGLQLWSARQARRQSEKDWMRYGLWTLVRLSASEVLVEKSYHSQPT